MIESGCVALVGISIEVEVVVSILSDKVVPDWSVKVGVKALDTFYASVVV